jgi:hypothetical protein
MMRFPDAASEALRSQALVEPADLWATLLDWWNVGTCSPLPQGEGPGVRAVSPTAHSLLPLVRGEPRVCRDRLAIVGVESQRAIRTPAWYLRAGIDSELFAKPSDRWEINNVATRCRDVVEHLLEALARYELTLPAGRISDLPPLDDILVHGLE